ncbi:unnamed protein product [Rotaria sp. Silwood1]|nr:unnamed protein product [Rotaria sp. Silwood1]CAF1498662.1 unnamed protein product [Rotaria sp. Silwood1]CAF3696124.1 unnamed protein product [Rotaria sp. Silwood1]CAF4892124.1 unnamed protein product [Rotaria sp. Silwood1]CAF4939019.1 unnamed protein product [Rotaria sp. Silwood1]
MIGPTFPTTYSCNTSTSCGCSTKSAILTRIIGGEAAGLQTWGWAVLLSIKDSLCGGSIIADSWILTAAHCVMGATVSQITIYAGSNAQRNGSQILSVATITIHPHYSPSTYVNDIALLYLSTPLNITDRSVSTICLPSVNLSTLSASEWPPPGTRVVAVGWGRLSENGLTASILQQVTMRTVDHRSLMCSSVINDWSVQFCAMASYKGIYS